MQARRDLISAATSAPKIKQDEIFLGTWSLKDLLAHLVGWDVTNSDSVKAIRRGDRPGCFARWNPDWAAYNAELVKQYKNDDWRKLLSEAQHSHRDLMEYLGQVPAEDFDKDFGVRSRGHIVTIARYLQGEIDDEREHTAQIKRWLG